MEGSHERHGEHLDAVLKAFTQSASEGKLQGRRRDQFPRLHLQVHTGHQLQDQHGLDHDCVITVRGRARHAEQALLRLVKSAGREAQ